MEHVELPTLAGTFKVEDVYRKHMGNEYALLPFRFISLDKERYVATNLAGEYVLLTRECLQALATLRLPLDHPQYEELKAKHFLIDNDSTVALDLLSAKYRTRLAGLAQLTSLFMFVVTLRCEHSCPYCQVSRQSQDRSAFDMTVEDAEQALNFVFQSPSNYVKIEFQGGEPLLNFELVRWIVERAIERNRDGAKHIAFVIATNLALVTPEILEFCKHHEVAISTSLDGPRQLHNANRPRPGGDSYERTLEGIKLAREMLGADRVAALMTTTYSSLAQPEAIIDEYVQQGFTSIFLRSLSPYGFAVKTKWIESYDVDQWLEFYKKGLSHILKLNLAGTPIREEYTTIIVRKLLSPFPTSYVDLQSPAGLGISCIAFNYDGEIYASDESRMLAAMNDKTFILGNLRDDTLSSVLLSDKLTSCLLSTMTEGVPMCSECGFEPYCGSDPVFHHATQGEMVGFKPRSGFCRKNMEIIRHVIKLLEDDDSSRTILLSWIS